MINDILDKVNLHKSRAKMALKEIKNWANIKKICPYQIFWIN